MEIKNKLVVYAHIGIFANDVIDYAHYSFELFL